MIWVAAALAAPEPVVVEVGEDAGAGQVLAVQAWLEVADYAGADALHARLDGWLDHAADRGALPEGTVVVLPEHVGTWLVAAGEPRAAASDTTRQALARVAKRHLFRFLASRCDGVDDRATCGLFAMKAAETAAAYQDVMGRLAREHRVWLVAGSVLLPAPEVRDGRIAVGEGPLHNAAFVFDPSGAVYGPVRKGFPTAAELPFTAAADPAELPTFDTPAGELGVLVCADGWFPDAWQALSGAELVVVPQFTSGEGAWSEPWGGYSGWPAPSDVDDADIGTLTEGEAWAIYGPTGRAPDGVDVVTVPLRGDLWDLGDDGHARWRWSGVEGDGPLVDGPVLIHLWRTP